MAEIRTVLEVRRQDSGTVVINDKEYKWIYGKIHVLFEDADGAQVGILTELGDTMERAEAGMLVAAGKYEVALTISHKLGRVLPVLVGVPNHTGIRIHAVNSITELDGCVGVGRRPSGNSYEGLVDARQAEYGVMGSLVSVSMRGTYIRIINP
jgi:hypothetical protein